MKRQLLVVLSIILALSSIGAAQPKKTKAKKKAPPCAADIEHCPDEGCGGKFDPLLNKQKNIRTSSGTPEDKDYSYLARLPKIVKDYKIGDKREKLAAEGEGKMIRVVAWALVARKGSSETCNCHLTSPRETDNHIVLVNPKVKAPSLATNEPTSQTAEFAPRVRLDHPKFVGADLQKLIASSGGKLLVRVSGQQMYDSEHALGPHKLKRKNDWEIHPVFGLEYCPKAKKCTAGSDANWVNIEQ
jgi:hypothetical protein